MRAHENYVRSKFSHLVTVRLEEGECIVITASIKVIPPEGMEYEQYNVRRETKSLDVLKSKWVEASGSPKGFEGFLRSELDILCTSIQKELADAVV